MENHFLKTKFQILFLCLVFFCASFLGAAPKTVENYNSYKSSSKAENDARSALVATLFYRFQEWINIFEKRIATLKSKKDNIQNRLELMKYYFFMAGIHVEWSHTLAFTSRYKIDSLADSCYRFISLTKDMAEKLISSDGLTEMQRAESYLYLGAAEGYLGIFEYGAGNLFQALVNGLQADGHLEEALNLDPDREEAYLGLGIYRYGNSRVGGIGNFIMQGGRDLRQVGIENLERSVLSDGISNPLAIKTLIWFYISEQINPANKNLGDHHPLSIQVSKVRARELIALLKRKFLTNFSEPAFPGNKELAMMQAIQDLLDGEYKNGKKEFLKVLKIIEVLKREMNFPINPQQAESVRAGISFIEIMELGLKVKNLKQSSQIACRKLRNQINYMDKGGTVLQYDSENIRNDIDEVFYRRLVILSDDLSC